MKKGPWNQWLTRAQSKKGPEPWPVVRGQSFRINGLRIIFPVSPCVSRIMFDYVDIFLFVEHVFFFAWNAPEHNRGTYYLGPWNMGRDPSAEWGKALKIKHLARKMAP